MKMSPYHEGIEDKEDGWSHQGRRAQEVGCVTQPQDAQQWPSSQQTAHRHSLIQPLAVAGADVDQLEIQAHITNRENESRFLM